MFETALMHSEKENSSSSFLFKCPYGENTFETSELFNVVSMECSLLFLKTIYMC